MRRDPKCIFCKIAAGEVPAQVVLDAEHVLAFLDVAPLAEGHLLVIPRSHCETLIDLPENVVIEVAKTLPLAGRALLEVTGAEGFNVLQNNGFVAGQVVAHVHFHLIPRAAGDGLGYRWNAGSYPNGRAAELCDQFSSALKRAG